MRRIPAVLSSLLLLSALSFAQTAAFDFPSWVAVDAVGDLYISSLTDPSLYRVSGGAIPTDGAVAAGTSFYTYNLRVDASGDVHSVDLAT